MVISIYCLPVLAVTMTQAHVLLTIWVSSFYARRYFRPILTRQWGYYCWISADQYGSLAERHVKHVRRSGISMEGPEGKQEKQKAGKTVRFRVASANSGRVLAEVFKDEAAWCGSASDSVDSDGTSSPEAEQGGSPPAGGEANSHLNGLAAETTVDANGCEPDDLLLYASAKRETLFSNKRINICSKNGTIRGVRNKVSAGQELFNSLSSMYSGSHRHQKRRPWEKQ